MEQFEKKVMQTLQSIPQLKGSHLLVACSGGVDSMALLHFLHNVQAKLQIKLSCVHVDHMLRGEQSYEDLMHVQAYCHKRDIPFYGKSIPIPSIVEKNGGNVQATCREERYTYFETVYEEVNCDFLATAHHLDDNVESILMSLTKNRSLSGLKGMELVRQVKNMCVIRPFLGVRKNEIREYLKKEKVDWREDPSNEKNNYLRNRFRNDVIPLLQLENEQFTDNLLAISNQIREDDEYLNELAYASYKNIVTKLTENEYKLKIPVLKREPLALQRRLLLILLNYVYGKFHPHPSTQMIMQILSLCQTVEGHGEIHLPNDIIVRRNYDDLHIMPKKPQANMAKVLLPQEQWTSYGQYQIYVGKIASCQNELDAIENAYFFASKDVLGPLYARPFKPGDRLLIEGMEQPKKVARILIDAKVPATERLSYPIIESNSTVIAVGLIRHHAILSKSKRPSDDCIIIFKGDSL